VTFYFIDNVYGYKYVAPLVADFSGDPADLVIDKTKTPKLKAKKNDATTSSLVETSPSSLVDVGELGTNDDVNDVVSDENNNVQVVQPRPTVSKGLKRKAQSLKVEDENAGNDEMPATSTKQRKVLQVQSQNKSTTTGSTSGNEQKPFKCPECKL
jgi:hypothetical protein